MAPVLAVALFAGACSGGQGAGGASGSPQAGIDAAASSPAAGKCPLTDKDPPPGGSAQRPILAVKVDGSLAAAPQAGLESADVVFDEPVEGGIGWFLALFQCGDPLRVGPVREARPEDAGLLQSFGSALLATAGGSQLVMDALRATPGIASLDASSQGQAFSRDSTRTAPHNLYANPAALRAAPLKGSLTTPGMPRSPFVFATGPPATHLGKANSVSFTLGPTVEYRYDATTNAYLRSENGKADLAASGTQLGVTNVVVLWVPTDQTRLDAAGNTTPNPVVVGQGNVMVLSDGLEHDGTWKRANASAPLSLLDRSGNPIPLAPGNTWIHLLASDGTASVG